MAACESAAHGERVFWATGSAVVAAPCPTDAGPFLLQQSHSSVVGGPPAGVNLLVLDVGGTWPPPAASLYPSEWGSSGPVPAQSS